MYPNEAKGRNLLAHSLAAEIGARQNGIRGNATNAGVFDTVMKGDSIRAFRNPDAVADTVRFLASALSNYITAASIYWTEEQ